MNESQVALVISGFAVAISIAGFAWSIWKEFIFVKPRVQVGFAVMTIVQPGWPEGRPRPRVCSLNVTNMGPGPVTLYSCIIKESRGLLRRRQLGLLNPIIGDPAADPPHGAGPFGGNLLPRELMPGKQYAFHFPYTGELWLGDSIVKIGVADTYGRNHWVRRRRVRAAKKQYQRDFPAAE